MSASLAIGVVCFPSLGGSGVVAAELATGMARRGHRVHLIASAPPRRPLPACERLSFHEIASSDYPIFEQPEYALAAASAIVDVARAHQLDVVHVHYAVPHAASAQLARQVLGSRAPAIVTTMHGTDVTHVGSHPSYRAVTSFTVAASDAITVPSDFLRREAMRLLELPERPPIEVIANFVDTEKFAPPVRRDRARLAALFAADGAAPTAAKGPVLFHVSNFRPVKRPLDLIDVLVRLRREVPARLVLVGDGPDRAGVEQRAAQLGVADSVRFLGQSTDFAEQLAHADAFLLTSSSESFGVAALEAASAGVPVCAYRVGGLPEVIPAGAGSLVEPHDVAALARAVLAATADEATREGMGRAARAHAVAHFRADVALAAYEALYHRLLETRS